MKMHFFLEKILLGVLNSITEACFGGAYIVHLTSFSITGVSRTFSITKPSTACYW
jgi:hypothetical protein